MPTSDIFEKKKEKLFLKNLSEQWWPERKNFWTERVLAEMIRCGDRLVVKIMCETDITNIKFNTALEYILAVQWKAIQPGCTRYVTVR
jgi:hypothetical protein